MNKMISVLIAAVLLCCMSIGFAEGEYLNIQEIRENAPDRWQKNFETKWRNVNVDAEIVIPDVEQLPVVFVSGGATEPALTAEETGWDEVRCRDAYSLILGNDDTEYPKSVDGVRVGGPTSKGSWYGDYEMEKAYIPMHDIALEEIISMTREKVALFGYNPDNFDWESPRQIWTHHIYAAGTKKDILPGYMYMTVSPKIGGVPVVSHIYKASLEGSTNRNDEFLNDVETHIGYDGYTDDFTHIFLSPLKINETLVEDIPLCSLDKVFAAVEKEINAGHIRKVYEIKLGYVIYNQPGVYREKGLSPAEAQVQWEAMAYYAKPMWQVNCLYVKSASGSLRDVSSYTDDERNSLDYHQLLIDAQTGEIVVHGDQKDRYEFKGFTSWDEVQ